MSAARCSYNRVVSLSRQWSQRALTTSARRSTDHVRIVEVGPRDGLQNEKTAISLETKLELIRRLSQTGLRDIEAGSFVGPKWVPQMANSSDVLEHILRHPPHSNHLINYNFLVPNMKGLRKYLEIAKAGKTTSASNDPTTPPSSPIQTPDNTSTQEPNGMPSHPTWQNAIPPTPPSSRQQTPDTTSSQDPNKMSSPPTWQIDESSSSPAFTTEISIFAAATEAFSKANTNCTIEESFERFRPILTLAKSENIRVRGYVSVALGCPYEGPNVDPTKVAEITATLLEMGADEVSVADTTGMGTVPRTQELMKALSAAGIASQDLALHFHDTYGQALVNTIVGLEHGIRTFDSSIGGLGGCPYSKGATGNVATEDLVYCLHSLGLHTGIDVQKVAEIGDWIAKKLGRANDTRAGKAILSRLSAS